MHEFTLKAMARLLYDLERQLPNRNYAKDHSFEEWYEQVFRGVA